MTYGRTRTTKADAFPGYIRGQMRDEPEKVYNNTWRWVVDEDGSIAYRLHTTDIFFVNPDGAIQLFSGGYRTVTTKRRMNQLLDRHNSRWRVFQRDFDWFVVNLDSRATRDFFDGITLR